MKVNVLRCCYIQRSINNFVEITALAVCSCRREEAELEEETSSVPHDMSYLDQLGEGTMESEEVCKNLIEEINGLLAESPDSPELLWRLCRALFHLSMHHDLKGNREEEQQLLVKG